MKRLIEQAVHTKRVIQLRYRGSDRIVEPHAYGLDRAGKALLLCYQEDDTDQRGAAGGWLRIRLGEVLKASETPQNFCAPRSGYIRNDPSFQVIFAQV